MGKGDKGKKLRENFWGSAKGEGLLEETGFNKNGNETRKNKKSRSYQISN